MNEQTVTATATVLPSSRCKHYGTDIVVTLDIPGLRGVYTFDMNVWVPRGRPSRQQLEVWGYTEEDWDNNIEIHSGWDDDSVVHIQDAYADFDNHYQSALEVAIAERIVQALDGWVYNDYR